ncbi:hypothetical protein ABIA32_002717 [Streptacidiphilus sp. MAP12-20]|uniref:hypothetical protein n=1 Tax=Streptacidiphilus sp. MAP12-20 TaxID=3156299 RepID=UPI003513094D
MALFGLFGNDRTMASSTYAGRESASARQQRKAAERETVRRASAVRGHRRAATKLDRQVAAAEDNNRRADSAPQRTRRWW